MGITVNGNLIVKGDQFADNAVKIVYAAQEKGRKEEEAQEAEFKEVVETECEEAEPADAEPADAEPVAEQALEIENGAVETKEEKETSQGEMSPDDMKNLKERIAEVLPDMANQRMWFPVCKYLMEEKIVPEGDFKAACRIIWQLFPDVKLTPRDLASMYNKNLLKPIEEWTFEKSLLDSKKNFLKYKEIVMKLKKHKNQP